MNRLTFFLTLVLFSSVLFGQEETIDNKQFMLGCTNVGSSEEVTHYITTTGEVWQYNSGTFITGGVYENSLVTIGNANFGSFDWPGFNFKWLDIQFTMPRWSLGLYKVTNSKQTDKYFYLDSRDSDFGAAVYNPDFYIYFDNDEDAYFNRGGGEITQGEVVRVWQIHEESPNTSGLQSYWSNALVAVKGGNNNPLVVWGPYPTNQYLTEVTYYEVWRKYGSLNWEYLGYVNSNTFLYDDFNVAGQQSGTTVLYKVRAVQTALPDNILSDYTNTASIVVQGQDPGKIKSDDNNKNISIENFELFQNYPNPFNPATVISYSIAENSFVSLKVYDVLGKEVSELINELKESGNYSVSFNASELSSGIYLYTLKANGYSLTRKMHLAK